MFWASSKKWKIVDSTIQLIPKCPANFGDMIKKRFDSLEWVRILDPLLIIFEAFTSFGNVKCSTASLVQNQLQA